MLGNLPATADYAALAAQAVVALVPLLILFVDLFFRGDGMPRRAVAVGLALVALVTSGAMLAVQYPHDYAAFGGAFVVGGFSIVFSEIAIVATIATLLLSVGVGRDDQVAGTTALILWSLHGRAADGGRVEPDDGLPRARAALARAVLPVRDVEARDRARVGAEVLDPQLHRVGILAVRLGAAVRRGGLRRVRRRSRRLR